MYSHHKEKKAAKRSCCLLEPPNRWFEVVDSYIRNKCIEHLLPPNQNRMSGCAQLRKVAQIISEEEQCMTICCLWKVHLNFQARADVEEQTMLSPTQRMLPANCVFRTTTNFWICNQVCGLLIHEGLHLLTSGWNENGVWFVVCFCSESFPDMTLSSILHAHCFLSIKLEE